jgi:expansin
MGFFPGIRWLLWSAAILSLFAHPVDAAKRRRVVSVPDTLPSGFFDSSLVHRGKATFYKPGRGGACTLPTGDTLIAAMSRQIFAKSLLCGACAEVSGPKGKVIVRLEDRCHSCGPDDLDLSRAAFAQLAPLGMGRAVIDWKLTECPGDTLPLLYRSPTRFPDWYSFQVRNHRLPLQSLEIRQDSAWKVIPRQRHNRFVARSLPTDVWLVRLTDAWGRQVTDSVTALAPDSSVVLRLAFPGMPRPEHDTSQAFGTSR